MSKVMTEIMEGHITNECCFCLGRHRFELFEPLVDSSLPKLPTIEFSFWNRECFPLRGEHIVAFSCSFSLLEILVEWLSCCVQEDNVPIFLPFMSHMEFANFPSLCWLRETSVHQIRRFLLTDVSRRQHRA